MKWINDNLGHSEGDMALVKTADIFRSVFRTTDIIARVGGDEFAVIAIESTRAVVILLKKGFRSRLGRGM